jgi:hypothetical protein
MPGSGLPSSLTVAGAFVAVYNPQTGDLNPIAAFGFEANDLTAQVLAQGPVLFEADIWFGFSADVDPFEPPDLGEGEIYALIVDFDVLAEELGSLIGQPVQLWGGEAFPNGVPDFQRGRYFTTKPPQIPAPR